MIELRQILAGLVLRTSEGRLKWRRAAQDDRFVTSVDAISIMIMEMTQRGATRYGLDIIDESGETVESLRYQDSTEDEDEQMARLYVLARRQALNIDSTLEKLAKGLEL